MAVELLAEGFGPLVFVTSAGDGTNRLYVVDQTGVIRRQGPGTVIETFEDAPFLDIVPRVGSGGERGLLGLAFHADFESNGRFFVNYTNLEGDTVVSEFTVAQPGVETSPGDPNSERILLTIEQPFPNHNGGMIAFGPDGYLYIGMGDGGSGGDPMGNGQALGTLLGKMLRIDVDAGDPYGIPADNPLVGGGGLPEIWSWGWRNPWRFSFDRETGDMFVGDVGQGAQEEIDAEPAGLGGRNYGWNVMEGRLCFRTETCDMTDLIQPVVANDRSRGERAIIGGYVYRGTQFTELFGTYLYSDLATGDLWAFDAASAVATGRASVSIVGELDAGPTSFGEDENGEIYLVNLSGELHRLVVAAT